MTATDLLERGEISLIGSIPYASNYTLLVEIATEEEKSHAIYKPARGERPLWDFRHGTLAPREVCAYLVSEAAGWSIVPPTVLRNDGPLGTGSVQLFVEHDPQRHYFEIENDYADELKVFAGFDAVVNNADRKAGHVLEGEDGKLWAVDHGVTFHVDPKLRTVIWRFAEEPLPPALIAGLERLHAALSGGLHAEIAVLLSPAEADATAARVDELLRSRIFPSPQTDRPYPWPLI